MSCPDERVRLLYAEDALEDEDRRGFELHLVACGGCRRAVVALRDEALLLSDVLQGRERAHFAAAAAAPAAESPGFAFGLGAALAAVTLALSAAGFLVEARMPGGLDVLNPLRVKGAYEMAFDLLFLLRDRAPGVLELAVSFGAVASVAALLSFAAGLLYRHLYGAAAAVLLSALWLAPGGAGALELRTGGDTRIAADETIDESMLLSCDIVWVDGAIEGDLIAAAERITIAGTVHGSLYVLARHLEITGNVEGSIHGIVEELRIDGAVQGSVYALAGSLVLGADGRVGRDALLIAEEGLLGGRIGRDVVFGGDALELRGAVGRNVEAYWAERVFLRDAAVIGGGMVLALRDAAGLDRAPGARVAGEVEVRPRERLHDHYLAAYRRPGFYLLHGLGLVAGFLFGLLLRSLAPVLFEGDLRSAADLFRAFGIGFLALVATPIAIALLALTLVGLPVALLALFAYLALLYTAEINVAAWLGRRLLPPRDAGLFDFARSLLLGLALVVVAGHVPFLGPAFSAVVLLVGLGLLVQQARRAEPLTA